MSLIIQKINNTRMKKMILSIVAMFCITAVMHAQTATVTPVKTTKPVLAKTTAAKKAGVVAATPATTKVQAQATTPKVKPAQVKTAAAANTTAVHLKKDGTPDKRFTAAPKAGPLKKDGTPDKRFKANKP